MLSIRRPQIEALARPQRERDLVELRNAARRAHPGATAGMPSQELDERLRDTRQRALRYGLVEPGDLVRFFGLQLALGREFDADGSRPWASEILRRPDAPSTRLDALHARATAERKHEGRQ